MDDGSVGDHETVLIDDVQQEIITDGLVENRIELSIETSTNDLSALATAAEFVPLLEEAKQQTDNNIRSDNVESDSIKTENEMTNNDQLDQDSTTQDEETIEYKDANEESVSSVSATTTPGEYFMTSSYQEMVEILNDYFERTLSRFVVQKKTKNFGLEGTVSIIMI